MKNKIKIELTRENLLRIFNDASQPPQSESFENPDLYQRKLTEWKNWSKVNMNFDSFFNFRQTSIAAQDKNPEREMEKHIELANDILKLHPELNQNNLANIVLGIPARTFSAKLKKFNFFKKDNKYQQIKSDKNIEQTNDEESNENEKYLDVQEQVSQLQNQLIILQTEFEKIKNLLENKTSTQTPISLESSTQVSTQIPKTESISQDSPKENFTAIKNVIEQYLTHANYLYFDDSNFQQLQTKVKPGLFIYDSSYKKLQLLHEYSNGKYKNIPQYIHHSLALDLYTHLLMNNLEFNANTIILNDKPFPDFLKLIITKN